MDEKLIGAYRFVFRTGEGQTVLDDLRTIAGVNEPFGADLTEGQLRHRAAFDDFFRYIEQMIEMETKPNKE